MRRTFTVAVLSISMLLPACDGQSDPITTSAVGTTTTGGPAQTSTTEAATTTTTEAATTTTTQPTTSTTGSETVIADAITVTIESTEWRVEPADVVVGPPGGFQLLVVNDTSEDQQIIFVSIFAGSPEDLPVADGQVDVSRCNQIFGPEEDDNPSPANFGCFGHLGEANPIEVIQLPAGERLPVDDGVPPGIHLIIDHRPGGYEVGGYVAFEVLEPPD